MNPEEIISKLSTLSNTESDRYGYNTNSMNENLYDIFESGGDIVVHGVKWDKVEVLIKFFNLFY